MDIMDLKCLTLRGLIEFLEKLETSFAKSEQGEKADTAVQSVKIGDTEYKQGTAVVLPELSKDDVINALGYTPSDADAIFKGLQFTTDCNSPAVSYGLSSFTNYDGTGNAPNREVRGSSVLHDRGNYPEVGYVMTQLFMSYYNRMYIRYIRSGEEYRQWTRIDNNLLQSQLDSVKGNSYENERRITMVTVVTGQNADYLSFDISSNINSNEQLTDYPMILATVNSNSSTPIGLVNVSVYHSHAFLFRFNRTVSSGEQVEITLQFNVTSTS